MTEANEEYIWKWGRKYVCLITTSFYPLTFVSAPFKSFSISLQILPPYDPGVIHKGKVVRLGLNLNSDPIVSLGSKHTRTFISGARAPMYYCGHLDSFNSHNKIELQTDRPHIQTWSKSHNRKGYSNRHNLLVADIEVSPGGFYSTECGKANHIWFMPSKKHQF